MKAKPGKLKWSNEPCDIFLYFILLTEIDTIDKKYFLATPDANSMQQWVDALHRAAVSTFITSQRILYVTCNI